MNKVVAVFCISLCIALVQCTKYNVRYHGPHRLSLLREETNSLLFRPLPGFSDPSIIAIGEYNATLLTIGWDTMKLTTSGTYSDGEQAYAAGWYEGQVTSQKAWIYMTNHYTKPVDEKINSFWYQNMDWMRQQVNEHGKSDPFWFQVGLMLDQFYGLLDGINHASLPGQNFSVVQLLSLTAMGDFFDLRAALGAPDSEYRRDWRNMSKPEYDRWFAKQTHCSSLFKLTANMDDIFFGHAAWYDFNTVMRIFKHLTLNYNSPLTTAKTISYSSYPGMLTSFDDFYLTDSGIVAIETSLGVLNISMYDGNISPSLLPYWVRVIIATRGATSAPSWADLIARYNSGTYNNQWMVLDLNKFTPGQALPDDTMWVAEQMPGVVKSRDVTNFLRYGYYPSYNVPMNEELFWLSGYAEAVKTQGPEMNDYQMNVRAQIFRRDQSTVVNMSTYKHIMQYNNYLHDPISAGNPLYAIASRVDLDPTAPECFGALDAKVSSWKEWKNGQTVFVWSGPTPQQAIFSFNTTKAPCGPHVGLPERFDFGFQTMQP